MTKTASIFIFYCFLCFHCIAENKAIITGEFKNLGNAKVNVYYYNNIDGYCNLTYDPHKININGRSGFRINFINNKSGFCVLELLGGRVPVFLNSTDSINIQVIYTVDSVKRIPVLKSVLFSGNNKEENSLYYDYYKNILNNQTFLLSIISSDSNCKTINNLFKRVSFILDSLTNPLKSSSFNGSISKEYFEKIKADITAHILVNTIYMMENMRSANSSRTNYYKNVPEFAKAMIQYKQLLTRASIDSLKTLFYQAYSPLDTSFLSSWIGTNYISSYYEDLAKKSKDYTDLYDSNFNDLTAEHRYLGYMKERAQEICWAKNLYWYIGDEEKFDVLKRDYELFVAYHPKSKYIKYLKQKFEEKKREEKERRKEEIANPGIAVNYINLKNDSTLSQVYKSNFQGRTVLMDLWATWCVPCIQQFSYKSALDDYLKKKNIEILYLSVDTPDDEKTWKDLIVKKALSGAHILASEALTSNIKKEIYNDDEITIPRYILLDKTGKVIDKDLPRPSDMASLKNTIDKLIK